MSRHAKRIAPYLLLAPFLVLFAIFWLGPILSSLWYSLTDFSLAKVTSFVGLENYRRLFSDPRFFKALGNTVIFWLAYSLILIGTSLGAAILIHSTSVRFKGLFRAAIFVPVTISMAVVAIIFEMVFARQSGLLNLILGAIGLATPGWLEEARYALPSMVIVKVWRAFGYYSLILLAGLTAIPRDVYEAAKIDGANWFQSVIRITLPLLRPVLAFVVIMSSIWALELFDEPWILTGGGPSDATLTVTIYLYQHAFQFMRLGYGSAIAFTLTALIVLIAYLQKRVVDSD